MTYNIGYDPALSGEARKPESEFAPFPFNVRKTIARRAAMELRPGASSKAKSVASRPRAWNSAPLTTARRSSAHCGSSPLVPQCDVVAKMAFRPLIAASLGRMRAELFAPPLLPADCFPSFQ